MNPRLNGMSGEMVTALSAAQQDVLVDLWQIDFRQFGGEIHYFCNQVNEKGQNVIWKGVEYQRYPIQIDGVELAAQGSSNRPTLNVANIGGLITGAAEQFNQLVGVKVYRIQTLSKFLDAQNFIGGNPHADPTQEVVSKYLVEQLSSLTRDSAALVLASPAESDGSVFPARLMMANTCSWTYRDADRGCPYRGRAVADRFDMPTDDMARDECSKSLLGCKARFGATAALPFGGFPSADKLN